MNTENQNDGTWSGYLVYKGDFPHIENVSIDADIDSIKKYKGVVHIADDQISLLRRISSGIFNKSFYGFYSFDKKPKSILIRIAWNENGEQKKEEISYPE